MSASNNMIVGVFRNADAAQRCYETLLTRGVLMEDVTLVVSERARDLHYAGRPATVVKQSKGRESKAAEGAGVGGAVGTLVGGSLAALAALGTSLVLPGLNLIVAGPLVAALAGGGAGALTGGLLGGLVGLGMTQDKAETYRKAIEEGCTVLGVRMNPDHDDTDVKDVMTECGAENVHTS